MSEPERLLPTGQIGLYIHIPFCARHCPYCDFAVTVTRRVPSDAYCEAVATEIEARLEERWRGALRSVYVGGGTPSMLEISALERIVTAGLRYARPDAEVTIEVNPEHVNPDAAARWVAAGVTRVSLGVQSFDDTVLASLGRAHTGDQARRAVELVARSGVRHISVDLIAAVPGEPAERARSDARTAVALPGVDHVSAYDLTVEPGTPLDLRVRRGAVVLDSEDDRLRSSDALRRELVDGGLTRYEVSNYARPGGASVHNAGYWQGHEYLGVGVGAHSLAIAVDDGVALRRANTRALRTYLADPCAPPSMSESVSAASHLAENVLMQLRTTAGVDVPALVERFGPRARRLEGLFAGWAPQGLGRWDGRRFVPSHRGLELADSLAVTMLSCVVD